MAYDSANDFCWVGMLLNTSYYSQSVLFAKSYYQALDWEVVFSSMCTLINISEFTICDADDEDDSRGTRY